MKKVTSLLFAFVFCVSFANSTSPSKLELKKKDCHAYACDAITLVEEAFDGVLSDTNAEYVYSASYNACMSNN